MSEYFKRITEQMKKFIDRAHGAVSLNAMDKLYSDNRFKIRAGRRQDFRYAGNSIIGQSDPMMAAFYLLHQAIADDQALSNESVQAKNHPDKSPPVLILGDTGTGKELFAAALHYNTYRSECGRLVSVNCAAVPESLLEAELFGYAEGSFTGAIRGGRVGAFAAAEGGTIYLDEIGDMPLTLQPKLLRVLDSRTFTPVGDPSHCYPVRARFVTSTAVDLEMAVRAGSFRADLYHRIASRVWHLPRLADRGEDFELLIQHFTQLARSNGRDLRYEARAINWLRGQGIAGNVRGLGNVISRAVAYCTGDVIRIEDDLEPAVALGLKLSEEERERTIIEGGPLLSLIQAERIAIVNALRKTRGNRKNAARILGVSPGTLHRKISKYEIDV